MTDALVWYSPTIFLILLGIVGVVCLGLIVGALRRSHKVWRHDG